MFLDFLKKITIPRNMAQLEVLIRQLLKLVFWILLIAPIIAVPVLFLLTTYLGIPVRLPG
ncbi:MAG: hypothetical protein E6K96_06130 [Thaumarchaeota archaeon]|nr:MAG: hypothetical protein E6K96_06130 [Nitrososphaerota archaeon]